jgi:hypothetical protein
MNDIPCICGHIKSKHKVNNTGYSNAKHICPDCDEHVPYKFPHVLFHTYVSDNLQYIENLAKQKGLV